MKKTLLIAALAGLSLVSCTKNYTCECTTTTSGTGMTTSTDVTTLTIRNTKSGAKTACEGLSSKSTSGSYTYDEVCVIK